VFSTLFDNIRAHTLEANAFIEKNNIEQCHVTLIKRQNLFEELFEQVSLLSDDNPSINAQLIELISWVQKKDKPNIESLLTKKLENTQKSIKQIKTNKAIAQYKNIR
jgi:flagellin-specific chaperone FliS